jgi:hypothetical protein
MIADVLVDTGAVIALLDRRDDWHPACSSALGDLRLPLITSEAVLTELFHLFGDSARETRTLWTFLRSGAVTIAPVSDVDLPRLNALMEKYQDRPMDFADATLVLLAERFLISRIFTVDHDDFETYRIGGRRPFEIVPDRLRKRNRGQPG